MSAGEVGTAYTQTITASGGTAPYSYAVTAGSLPAGLTLSTGGVLSGTPTTAASASFTVTATDANNDTGDAAYTLQVNAGPATFVFDPAGGALPEAMDGEDYSAQITATGGTGMLIYSLASGAMPAGLVLNVSTGELTGPIAEGAEGSYTFTIQVMDGNGSTGTATYSLVVGAREVKVTDKAVDVAPGSAPTNVNLEQGATGGPFTAAEVVAVFPANAGTAEIVNGEFALAGPPGPLGWYLKFIPNPAYSGQVSVQFRLISGLGVSNTGTVTYNLGYDPAAVAVDMDTLVHGFVQTRQNLIASTIKAPGLLERRRMAAATDPVTARMSPAGDGVVLGFSTGLAQIEAARHAAGGAVSVDPSPFNVWIDGTFMLHNRAQNDHRWGNFAMVSAGADYLLSQRALLGLSFHFDRMTDPTDADATLKGNGWLIGPYASFEIGNGVFWDASAFYGGSSNSIDTAFWDGNFDTRRWLFDTSITGQWKLDEVTTLTPRLRAVYLSETVEDYAVSNGAGDVIGLGGFTTDQFRLSLGAEIARQFMLEDGAVLTPKLGATGGVSGLDGSGAFGQLSAGVSYQTPDAWTFNGGLLFNVEGDGQMSVGAKIRVGAQF
ncbi:putative Ig domain-containing protein [Hoeflea olei]|uniref:putative Ig domain-containing protein n=1 Tax=Hoeflea olei TaxID=1480615 RepID=UPI0014956A7E|nr:putative Ig domain-containing protein [Hoeflea olei]